MVETLEGALLSENRVEPQRYAYKEFKTLSSGRFQSGRVIVSDMSPSKLWASQDWVDNKKVQHVTSEEGDGTNALVQGYFRDMPTGQRAIILANGHHHTLRAYENGEKVDVEIIGQLPLGHDFISFSRYRRTTGGALRGL